MGHIRLGSIPKTQPWRSVVAAVLGETAVAGGTARNAGTWPPPTTTAPDPKAIAEIASRTLDAAEGGLERCINDAGLRYTFFLLASVTDASRSDDWFQRLSALGIELSPSSSAFDLSAALQAAIDDHLNATATDISELAQRAAGETLAGAVGTRADSLFGSSGEELRLAVRSFSTTKGFGELANRFYGRFLTHYLNFYVSRVTAATVGRGQLQTIADISQFNDALSRHCEQSAGIVREFAAQWYSKAKYQKRLNLEGTGGFVAVAMRKLRAELRTQRSAK